MTPLENVLDRLEKVRRGRPGQWSARCPAHDDKGPSLSVRETPDGAVLLHCFGGCETADVVAAMGLQMTDLFPPRDIPANAPKKIANLLTASQALELLASESLFVAVALTNYLRGITLTPADTERLRLAAGRIGLLNDQTGRTHA
ncbi:hypothetical protein RF819_02060 [Rhodoferax fermentans]|uniref:DNA primase n=1 Tax=Rhodoferax fermentans TaxID=28066 RepID=A0A1T1ANS2_RHOFE|nr:DNA primase [Rhodoferax fermentans]OOV05655.1 hypothetical protein RF819_02060 [Rhodoferax fermentans]